MSCLGRMDQLSPETMAHIVTHIKPVYNLANLRVTHDLANFRLVQRSFAELATQRTFEVILVQPTHESFCRLLAISQTPNLARHVKSVVLHFDNAESLIMEALEHILRQQSAAINCFSDLSDIMEPLFRRYYEFQTSPQYTAILETVFKNLPRLDYFEIRKSTRCSWIDPLIIFGQTMQSYSIQGTRISTIIEENHGLIGERDHFRAFEAAVTAAHLTDKKFNTFLVRAWVDETQFFQNTELLQCATKVLRHCSMVEFQFDNATRSPERHNLISLEYNSMFNILSPVVSLKAISLKFSMMGDRLVEFPKLFGVSYVWHGLEEVELTKLYMQQADIIYFLKRHKATLRRVKIVDCQTSNWRFVAKCMREHLNLVELVFENLGPTYSYEDIEDMVDYVLGRSSELRGYYSNLETV